MNRRYAMLTMFATCSVAATSNGQSLIREHLGPASGGALGTAVAALHDLDGDGAADYAISDPGPGLRAGTVDVISGATGATLFTIQGSWSGTFGASLSDAGDVDGDGVSDLLVGDPGFDDPNQSFWQEGAVRTYSGKDGTLIHEIFGGWTFCNLGAFVTGLDDVNGDGVPDFLISAQVEWYTSNNVNVFGVSGKDGAELYRLPLDYIRSPVVVGSDRDGDGIRDCVTQGVLRGDSVVRAFSGATGKKLYQVNYSRDFSFPREAMPVAEGADFDGDGQAELLVEWSDACIDCTEQGIDVLSIATGTVLRTYQGWTGMGKGGAYFYREPASISDLDGDGVGEYLMSYYSDAGSELQIVSGRSGQLLYRSPLTAGHKVPVGDLDGNGVGDLLAPNANYFDPALGIGRGIVQVYSNDEFWIEATPTVANPGDVETFVTGRVPTGNPIGIAATLLNGTPIFEFISIATADANGRLSLVGTVPPGLSGLSVEFQGFAIDRTGRLVESASATITFQ